MPPSIWARMMSGLTATPQSTAHQTLCTFGSPSAPERDLGDLGDEGAEALDHRDAARAAVDRAGPVPVRQSRATALSTPAARGCRLPIRASRPCDRVLPRRLQQLIDEALDRIGGMGMADRAPPQGRHADLGIVHLAAEVGDLVEDLVGALDRVASMPFFTTIASKGVPRKKDWPTMLLAQAMILPSFTAPRRRCTKSGR